MKYTIDATNKKLGRVATEAATLLMGKNRPDFERHILSPTNVEIINVSHLELTQKKMKNEKYVRYTGYPGGLRSEPMDRVINKKGYGEIVRRAVYGMLPANKLRSRMMKNLVIKE